MNKQRIYTRLQKINDNLYDLEVKLDTCATEHDKKEVSKKRSKLIKERNKLKKRLFSDKE
tara:strand:- start:439 stop:618 length:180 start_codon:yes stop_codon:yes gene_type:complete